LIEDQALPRKAIGQGIGSHAAFICIAAIFMSPVFSTLLLSSWNGTFSDWQSAARLFFLPALYLEIAICIFAFVRGFSFAKLFACSPMSVKIFFALWLMVFFTSTMFADTNQSAALVGTGFWIVHILFFMAVAYLVRMDGIEALHLETLSVLLAASAAFSGIVLYGFANIKGLDGDLEWVSYLPGFAHIRHTGYVFAPAIAISLAHMAARPNKLRKTHMVLLVLNTALMLWLGSRGPVFAVLVASIVCMSFFSEMRSFRFLLNAAIAGITGAILSLIAPLPNHGAFGAIQRFWSSSSDPTAFSSGRLNFWSETAELILQQPLIGHGVFQFQFVSTNAAGIYKHPHNSILQFMFDWGVIGAGLLVTLIGFAIHAAFFKAKPSPYVRLVSAMGFTTMLAFSLLDGVFFYSYTIAISMIFVILPIATGYSNPKSSA
jgi:O-antigen ligase